MDLEERLILRRDLDAIDREYKLTTPLPPCQAVRGRKIAKWPGVRTGPSLQTEKAKPVWLKVLEQQRDKRRVLDVRTEIGRKRRFLTGAELYTYRRSEITRRYAKVLPLPQ